MGKSSKDKRDIFYRLAKEEGWRARSAFKLLQIDEQFNIFEGVRRAVDLCAAPGSWSQVLSKELPKRLKSSRTGDKQAIEHEDKIKIVSVDIQTMAPLDGVTMIQGDITSPTTAQKVIDEFKLESQLDEPQDLKAQLVVCDGAPDVTGQHDLDEFMQSQLLLAALNITSFILETRGTFVAKIFRGRDISLMISQFRVFFKQVQVIKPKSSRTSSIEAFIICQDFGLPAGYKPMMFDLLTSSNNYQTLREAVGDTRSPASWMVPFLMCGDLNKLKVNQEGDGSNHCLFV